MLVSAFWDCSDVSDTWLRAIGFLEGMMELTCEWQPTGTQRRVLHFGVTGECWCKWNWEVHGDINDLCMFLLG